MSYTTRRRQSERRDLDRFEDLIVTPHDFGPVAPGGTSASPLTLPGNGRLALSHSVGVSTGDVTVTVSGEEDFTHPDLEADEVHDGHHVEQGRAVNVAKDAGAPNGAISLYVVDPFGRRRLIAGSQAADILAPVIDLNGAAGGADFAAVFTEGDPAVFIADATAVVSDGDSPTLESMTVTVTDLVDTGEELLDADVGATGITKLYAAPTLTLTGPASPAGFQEVLRTVTYENTMITPTEGDRTVEFSATDGTNASNTPQTVVTVIALPTDPAEIVVNAVHFDGTNDFLTRDAGLDGATDNKKGIYSFWVNFVNDDAGPTLLDHVVFAARPMERIGTDEMQVAFTDAAGTSVWLGRSTTKALAASGWLHVLASVNSETGDRSLYINDIAESLLIDTFNLDGIIRWIQTNWSIGADTAGANKLNGDLAEVYFTNEFLDFTVEANRRKFISIGGKPVELGANGEDPLSATPLVYFSGPTVDWHTNKGSGGGFTEVGALTDASSSPSD
jgi:hypothetical protein